LNSVTKPEDFPIGSLESRAAARVLLGRRQSKQTRVQFFHGIRGPWRGNGPEPPDLPRAYPWTECGDGKLVRVVYIPHVWIPRDEAAPICPGCSKPYRKDGDYPNFPFVGYQADCVDKHITDFSSPG
jgi:hypothetical protein